ncbi:hypothetical protein CDD82_5209 [Ophiocordyceps australis]|uniref:NAD dependent epimerase/dehydratase n=1 Tax=Ophiocordyceps australis TaxID=1399860 RepID=A0A2C5Y469_9HYPO|nr:hypothetical protein CDD82_5209 [Ophiocordyceps australis]
MKVLSLGLPRTGSASMARALTILGYENVCHGLDLIEAASPKVFNLLDRACDATYPALPSYTGKAFSVDDWEELYRDCEASTDAAGVFAPQMMQCYPDAQVILAIRPFDKWYESVNDGLINTLLSPAASIVSAVLYPIFGSSPLSVLRKVLLGLLKAKTAQEARDNARSVYDYHHAYIKMNKPASQLLVYDIRDGWGPLCQFLGKPVPPDPFPRINERAAIRSVMFGLIVNDALFVAKKSIPWLLVAVTIGAGIYYKFISSPSSLFSF